MTSPFELGYSAGTRTAHKIAKRWTNRAFVQLHAGELTGQEWRSVLAVVSAIMAEIGPLNGIPTEPVNHQHWYLTPPKS